ncbi:MAG: amino acid adenylation domain-containing protein, partial [Gammaproteobacteria bacterium]|nr:amino acid adenylation domain-containing protein [Gammaproteobacteria bacterium]MBU2395786.1 amino acid adenylation domain-containing protein [Gammaproteobacteria bacterium]
MSIEQLLGRLKDTGAKINLVDGEVKLALPKSVSDSLKAELVERKAELKYYLETLFKLKETIPKIIPQHIEQGEVPLSYAQQRLWFINQLNPGSTEYNMQSVLTIQGYLDVDLVEQSFRLITDRHQILRTVYRTSGHDIVQCIQKQHNFALTRHDLTQFSAELQLTRLTELLHADRVLPFALDKDLMLRASVIQLQHQDNGEGAMATAVLALSMHHIASDGWSVQVLLKEFISIYQALIISQPVILPDLTVQYADYAHWQRQWLQGDVLETQLRYWQKQLADLPTVHGLTLSKPRPEEPLRQGAVLRGQLSAEIVEQLTAVARSHQMTAFMLLHAGLALVLARHSNSQDIVLGTPVANRRQLELESLLGFFVNTLVLRVDTGENDLALYLAHVRQVHLDAQSHQDVPFEQLVERLKVPRSNTHTPLFQIMLTMNTDYGLQGDNHDIKLENLTFTPWSQDVVSTKFDLNIAFVFRNSMLELEWTYDTGLFSEDYIAQLNEHCLRLFTSLSKVPVLHFTTTAELAMLSAQDIHFLQHELNNTRTEHPQGDLMHELFEAQVLVTPEKLALICGAEQFSFARLNERANQLAHYLRAQGVVAGSLVGIALTRSSLMVVSILAVLKTGAAYVPLDPESPAQRLEYMLEDTGVQLLLTESCQSDRFSSVSARLLVLDLADLHSYSSDNLRFDCGQATDSLMYVIYTSGSTGKPKGVMVPHCAVANLAYSIRSLGLGGASGSWGWIASFAFDASVQGLTQMLLGQTLIVITETQKHDVQQLKQQIQQHQIGVLDCSPALLELWSYQATGDLVAPELGVDLLVGGEAISPSLWRALLFYQQQQGRLAYNVYGPTECTVDSCWAKITGEVPVIGVMMPNTEGMILNQQRQLVPFGCVGELYIGGAGLARGYLNQQELTAQSFIPHPFSDLSGARLYKTGDLVRYTVSGQLSYIGRADEQVKIRGYRIELGEIEQQLSRCEGVSGQLVIARPDASGDKRLVAYISLTE